MAIDDLQPDALRHQLEMEDLSTSAVGRTVLAVASKLPLPWPLDKAVEALKDHLVTDSLERIRLLLDTVMAELRKHDEEIRKLQKSMTASASDLREETLRGLLLDAARKAESTRAKERVKRIGLILANAAVESKPTDGDEVEEMMRVATELSDRDIQFLRDLIGVQGQLLQTGEHIPRYQAYMAWERGPWGNRIDTEIDSVFSKLESYGLVVRIPPPNNLNISADFQNRYVLLKKGARFAALIQEASTGRP